MTKLAVRKIVLLVLSFVFNTKAKLLSHYKPARPIYWSANWMTGSVPGSGRHFCLRKYYLIGSGP